MLALRAALRLLLVKKDSCEATTRDVGSGVAGASQCSIAYLRAKSKERLKMGIDVPPAERHELPMWFRMALV